MVRWESIRGRMLSPARKERLAYFKSIPTWRLVLLAAAACLIFAAIGLMSAMLNGPSEHPAGGLLAALVTAAVAAAYIVTMARKPGLFLAVTIVQLGCTWLLSHVWLAWIARHSIAVPEGTTTRIYAAASIACIAGGYSLFLVFIQMEGRFAFRAQTELALAHGIQETLVPAIDRTLAGCALYGISVPSEKVGGDLVDAVELNDGGALAYVADIAGHGLAAGILMGMLKTAIRTCLLYDPAPAALFASLNKVLPQVKEAHMYGTCAALRLQPVTGGCQIEYSLAAHPAVLHFSGQGVPKLPLMDQQFPLGLLEMATYRSQTIAAASGDLLVAATDGILEACDADGRELGMDGLATLVAERTRMQLPKLAAEVLTAVKHRGRQDDDQTLLLIRVL